jgi:hydroxymethylpyrimidine/phosphomethylpyrimidine kinase
LAGPASTPRALTIAGSDSGGGAGIQADLKAFARCGVHGMTAITAVTAQNTVGVDAVQAIDPQIILAQVRAVVRDIGVDAVKVGMLGTAATARAVARALAELDPGTPIVVDPVMVAESGARLLEEGAERVLVAEILPLASVITPNLPEARALAAVARGGGGGPDPLGGRASEADVEGLARELRALGPSVVVITGGHREQAVDLFFDGGQAIAIAGERHRGGAAHGSGCTHSSVLAAQLALGATPLQAARTARALAGEAVRRGLREIGQGPGPVDVIGLDHMRGSARGSG